MSVPEEQLNLSTVRSEFLTLLLVKKCIFDFFFSFYKIICNHSWRHCLFAKSYPLISFRSVKSENPFLIQWYYACSFLFMCLLVLSTSVSSFPLDFFPFLSSLPSSILYRSLLLSVVPSLLPSFLYVLLSSVLECVRSQHWLRFFSVDCAQLRGNWTCFLPCLWQCRVPESLARVGHQHIPIDKSRFS